MKIRGSGVNCYPLNGNFHNLFLDVIPVDAVVLRHDVDTVVGGLLHHQLVLHQELLQPGGVVSLVTDGLQEYPSLAHQQPLVGLQFIFLVGRFQHLKYLDNTITVVSQSVRQD